MPIEESLGRIAIALETIAAAGATTVVNNETETPAKRRRSRKPAAEAAPETPPETPEPESESATTRDTVREALRIFRKDHTKDEARAVLAEFEVKSITAASDEVLPALLKAFSV